MKRTIIWCIIILTFFLASTITAQEQTIEVRTADCQPSEKQLTCELIVAAPAGFTLDDQDDFPIIQVVEGEKYLSEANVLPTSYDILFLLDSSGSMVNAQAAMKEAAIEAIGRVPEGSRIAIATFNEPSGQSELLQFLHLFGTDLQTATAAIDRLSARENAGTCLYDALTEAVFWLGSQSHQANGQRQQAIVLFTDGRDEVINAIPCSQRSLSDVTTQIDGLQEPIQIHTIGLGERLQAADLSRLSAQTGGMSVFGGQADLTHLFEQVMLELHSQWLITTALTPTMGEHLAALIIKTADDQTYAAAFPFTSDKDYTLGTDLFSIQSIRYVETQHEFEVMLELPEAAKLALHILSDQDDLLLDQTESTVTTSGRHAMTFSAAQLDPEGSYRLQACMINAAGITMTNEDGDKLCDLKKITYPQQLPTLEILSIEPLQGEVTIEGERFRQLKVQLQHHDTDSTAQVNWFVENSMNTVIPETRMGPIPVADEITIRLPANAALEETYELTINLVTEDGRTIMATTTDQFGLPPIGVGFFNRLRDFFEEKPIYVQSGFLILQLALLIIFLSTIIYLGLNFMREQRRYQTPAYLGPPTGAPRRESQMVRGLSTNGNAPAAAESHPDLSLGSLAVVKIIHDSALDLISPSEIVVSHLPFDIGRQGTQLNLLNTDVSRRHAVIKHVDGQLCLEDQGSSNGTYLNGHRLPPRDPILLPPGEVSIVRFGTEAVITIEPRAQRELHVLSEIDTEYPAQPI